MNEKNEIEPDDSASYLITGKALERYFQLNQKGSRFFVEDFQERLFVF